MVESVGKKLSQARAKRGLTLEEVAHVTKLRPDKIVALETDDYSSFPSNAYAKGFLQIYARYLRVDVSEFLPSLESSNSISVDDYQYLSNAPAPKPVEPERRADRRPPSIAPLVFFIFVALVVIGGGKWVITNYQRTLPSRTSDTEDGGANPSASNPSPGHPAAAEEKPEKPEPPTASSGSRPFATPAIVAAASPAPAASPLPHSSVTLRSTPLPAPGGTSLTATTSASTSPAIAPAPAPTPRTGSSALSDRDFVTPTAVVMPESSAFTTPRSGLNEVQVASVKKTWVTIRRDSPKAPPIFEDYIYPNTNPLKLKGARFFIDARDPSAVQITMNGLPFAFPETNAPVQ
jgi:cytoskeletal protein RodZ